MKTDTTVFLLAEDNAYDRELVQQAFRRKNCRLQVVPSGLDAKEYLEGSGQFSDREQFPLPDVVLLDLEMPLMNGFQFLEWLRAQAKFKLLPVVVMSSSGLPQNVERAYALGANSYLVKPLDWPRFRERVKALTDFWAEHVETPPMRDGHVKPAMEQI